MKNYQVAALTIMDYVSPTISTNSALALVRLHLEKSEIMYLHAVNEEMLLMQRFNIFDCGGHSYVYIVFIATVEHERVSLLLMIVRIAQ